MIADLSLDTDAFQKMLEKIFSQNGHVDPLSKTKEGHGNGFKK